MMSCNLADMNKYELSYACYGLSSDQGQAGFQVYGEYGFIADLEYQKKLKLYQLPYSLDLREGEEIISIYNMWGNDHKYLFFNYHYFVCISPGNRTCYDGVSLIIKCEKYYPCPEDVIEHYFGFIKSFNPSAIKNAPRFMESSSAVIEMRFVENRNKSDDINYYHKFSGDDQKKSLIDVYEAMICFDSEVKKVFLCFCDQTAKRFKDSRFILFDDYLAKRRNIELMQSNDHNEKIATDKYDTKIDFHKDKMEMYEEIRGLGDELVKLENRVVELRKKINIFYVQNEKSCINGEINANQDLGDNEESVWISIKQKIKAKFRKLYNGI